MEDESKRGFRDWRAETVEWSRYDVNDDDGDALQQVRSEGQELVHKGFEG